MSKHQNNPPVNRGFQSQAALEATIKTPEPEETDPSPAAAGTSDDGMKMVKVIPRQTIPRAFIGGTQYSFTAGKACLVPEDVKRHLTEKGIL